MFGVTGEHLDGTAKGLWRGLMNDSPMVPIIAVVDDDESVREALAGLAESVGYTTELYASAEDFLRPVGDRESLACLILDVRLPGMSGIELFSQLPPGLRSIPTIFITAHADAQLDTCASTPGVIAVLYKPFQPQVLLQAVRKAIVLSRA
jgi:FixJ family two-component response regulator